MSTKREPVLAVVPDSLGATVVEDHNASSLAELGCLGHPLVPVARVLRERTEGKTAYAIARDLNKDAVPVAR